MSDDLVSSVENDKINFQRGGSITISTTVDYKLWSSAKDYKISWTKALELGLQMFLSEIDPDTYSIPECELKRKVIKLRIMLEEKTKELEKLEEKNEKEE